MNESKIGVNPDDDEVKVIKRHDRVLNEDGRFETFPEHLITKGIRNGKLEIEEEPVDEDLPEHGVKGKAELAKEQKKQAYLQAKKP